MKTRQQVRIIAGAWRGRKIQFPDIPGIRPTPDRVRETLFNWLQNDIVGACCLDLFAGSGALGLEALSRGAEHVVFIDSQNRVVEALKNTLSQLDAKGQAMCMFVKQYCRQPPAQPFDVIFLDPPFNQDYLTKLADVLTDPAWIKPGGYIYLEHEAEFEWCAPIGWNQLKAKKAGAVGFELYQITFP